MKDNTMQLLFASVLTLTIGSCVMHENHLAQQNKLAAAQTVTNTVTEPSAISTIALSAALRNSETTAQLVALNATIVDHAIALHKRVAELETRLAGPPKTILEGYTNIYISPDLIYTNTLKWVTNLHETH